MTNKLFVGNIDWNATVEQLIEEFGKYGELESREDGTPNVVIISDKFTGRPKGFGFVSFVSEEDAQKAMEALDGFEVNGRPLAVKEARPREERPRYDSNEGAEF